MVTEFLLTTHHHKVDGIVEGGPVGGVTVSEVRVFHFEVVPLLREVVGGHVEGVVHQWVAPSLGLVEASAYVALSIDLLDLHLLAVHVL